MCINCEKRGLDSSAGCDVAKPMFAVGDKVYSLAYGPGTVVPRRGQSKRNPAILVDHMAVDGQCFGMHYHVDGRLFVDGDQVLFHDKPTITIPKRKVKKWKWAYKASSGTQVTSLYYTDYEKGVYIGVNEWGFNAVKLPWTEIEE